jgi:hypothetical protein
MQRFGIRRVVLGALVLLATGTALSTLMHMPWHMLLSWGCWSVPVPAWPPIPWAPPSSAAGSRPGAAWRWAC